jgi:hypothetical protein
MINADAALYQSKPSVCMPGQSGGQTDISLNHQLNPMNSQINLTFFP